MRLGLVLSETQFACTYLEGGPTCHLEKIFLGKYELITVKLARTHTIVLEHTDAS